MKILKDIIPKSSHLIQVAALAHIVNGHVIQFGGQSPMLMTRNNPTHNNIEFKDDGCELAPSCLSCPLEFCKYDDPYQTERVVYSDRRLKILALKAKGLTTTSINRITGISKGVIRRIVAMEENRQEFPDIIPELKKLASRKRFKSKTY